MKALRILLALFVVTCLFTLPTSAQNNRVTKGSYTEPWVFEFPCIGEPISGTFEMEFSAKLFTANNNRVGVVLQHYKNTGTFIGDITGAEYTVRDQNTMFDRANAAFDKGYVNATAITWVLKDGEKVARMKLRHHLTFVNGEAKVYFHVEDAKCF